MSISYQQLEALLKQIPGHAYPAAWNALQSLIRSSSASPISASPGKGGAGADESPSWLPPKAAPATDDDGKPGDSKKQNPPIITG